MKRPTGLWWAQASSMPGSKGGRSLGYMNENTTRSSREGIIFPYSAILGPHLGTVSSFGTPSTGGTSETWSEFSIGTPQPSGLEHLSCEEKLRDRGLFSLEKKWLLWGLP